MLNVKVTLFIVLLLSLRLIIHGINLMKVLNSLHVSFYLFSFSFVLFFRFHCPLSCTDHWSFLNARWDYQVTGPSDERVRDFDRRSTATFEFVAYKKGLYKFCFTNKSPYHETPDFDIHVAHYAYHDQHAKDGENETIFLPFFFRSLMIFVNICRAY